MNLLVPTEKCYYWLKDKYQQFLAKIFLLGDGIGEDQPILTRPASPLPNLATCLCNPTQLSRGRPSLSYGCWLQHAVSVAIWGTQLPELNSAVANPCLIWPHTPHSYPNFHFKLMPTSYLVLLLPLSYWIRFLAWMPQNPHPSQCHPLCKDFPRAAPSHFPPHTNGGVGGSRNSTLWAPTQ